MAFHTNAPGMRPSKPQPPQAEKKHACIDEASSWFWSPC